MPATPVSGWKSSENAHTTVASVSGIGLAAALINAGHVWPAVIVFFGPVIVTALYARNRSDLKGLAMSAIASGITATPSTSSTIVDMIDSAADTTVEKIEASATPKIKAVLVNAGLADADAEVKASNLANSGGTFVVNLVDVAFALVLAKCFAKKTAAAAAK